MCYRCAPTYVRFTEGAQGFKDLINTKIQQRGLIIPSDGVKLFAEVSGLRIFALPKKAYYEKQAAHAPDPVEAAKIGAHVVQRTVGRGEKR